MSFLKLFCAALLYLFVAILIAGLIAYPVYQLFDLDMKFPRLVNRLSLGLLIIGIYPCSKTLGIDLRDMGFADRLPPLAGQFCKGFAAGVALLGVVVWILFLVGVRYGKAEVHPPYEILRHLAGALTSGFFVALLEETLFRGLLFGACLKFGNLRSALCITAFFYAGLHFIAGRGEIPAGQLDWSTGIQLVPAALAQIFNPGNLDSMLALAVVSLFLCTVLREIPRSIGYCMGLHAAWVFLLKLTKRYSEFDANSSWSFLVGSYDGIIGYLVSLWLGSVLLIYQLWKHKSRHQEHLAD